MATPKSTETDPLLAPKSTSPSTPIAQDEYIVDFTKDDPSNPLNWPNNYKWTLVSLLAALAFEVTFSCISLVPVASHIITSLGGHQKSSAVLLVTIWELGEAAGPLFIATLSEIFGRYPVINAANGLFIAALLVTGFAPSVGVLLAARFATGLAVASNVLNPAVVGDIFLPEQRGAAMSVVMFLPLFSGAVGPSIGGWIAEHIGWRSIMFIGAGVAAVVEGLFLFGFRETYRVTILKGKARRLREETGDGGYRSRYEVGEVKMASSKIWVDAVKPLVVLYGSGVLLAMSLYGAVAYTFFYILSTTLPDILQEIYGLSPTMTGAAFISFSIGSLIALGVCNRLLDGIYIKLRDRNHGIGRPEYRLPLVIIGAIVLPAVITLYGWSAHLHWPLPVMLAIVASLGAFMMFGFIPVMSYVVDAFEIHSASAMTAVIVLRCLCGTFLPLLTSPLIDEFGYGWAFTILAGITICMAPIPMLVMRYGHKWRQRSEYSRDV